MFDSQKVWGAIGALAAVVAVLHQIGTFDVIKKWFSDVPSGVLIGIEQKGRNAGLGRPHPNTPIPLRTAPNRKGEFGYRQRFLDGWVYWSPSKGPQVLKGAIFEKWQILNAEKGSLGFPATDELIAKDTIGRYNEFEEGAIYWTSTLGAWAISGPVWNIWKDMGREESCLGYPISDVVGLPKSPVQDGKFQNGLIHWSKQGDRTFLRMPVRRLRLR